MPKSDNTRAKIDEIAAKRDARRKAMEAARRARKEDEAAYIAAGRPGDVDFQRLVTDWRAQNCGAGPAPHTGDSKRIIIAARKRPIGSKEVARHDYDAVTCLNPYAVVHCPKRKIDGISKYVLSTL